MIASVKQRVDGEAAEKADSVKKIPIAEKKHRLEQQEQRLSGISISGELEPSHQLIDLANNVLETGALVWIAPSRCTKRSDEVQLAIREGHLQCRWKTSAQGVPDGRGVQSRPWERNQATVVLAETRISYGSMQVAVMGSARCLGASIVSHPEPAATSWISGCAHGTTRACRQRDVDVDSSRMQGQPQT